MKGVTIEVIIKDMTIKQLIEVKINNATIRSNNKECVNKGYYY